MKPSPNKLSGASHQYILSLCPGFSCGRVTLIPRSWYSAMFWIKGKNNIDNTLMI